MRRCGSSVPRLALALALLASASLASSSQAAGPAWVSVPVPKPRDERIVPLGPAEVRELAGELTIRDVAAAGAVPMRMLRAGDTLPAGAWLRTSSPSASRVELRFTDGSLLRLGPDTEVSIIAAQRQIILHRGRVLVVADRMVGGIAVLTATRAFLPEGTTYLVDSGPTAASPRPTGPRLAVLEGAVCACAVEARPQPAAPGKPRPLPQPQREPIVLSGEAWTLPSAPAPGAAPPRPPPLALDLAATLRGEPLLVAFATPLPSLAKITELADQQRRRLLAGRNARLRREIFWKRPPRAPLKLPALLAAPSSVTVTYD